MSVDYHPFAVEFPDLPRHRLRGKGFVLQSIGVNAALSLGHLVRHSSWVPEEGSEDRLMAAVAECEGCGELMAFDMTPDFEDDEPVIPTLFGRMLFTRCKADVSPKRLPTGRGRADARPTEKVA